MSTPSLALRLNFEPLRSLAFGAIGAGYMGIGTAIEHPARQIKIDNLTDASLYFSINGIDDHFVLPADGFLILDITANQTMVGAGFFLGQGSRLYVKQLGVPTQGAVYFSVIYADV